MRYLFTVLGLCLITISMQAQNWDWNCDCEIDFTEPFICAADVDGNIVPVPNECFADCLELTVVDSEDCLDDGTIFGLDSLWLGNDCDCEISEDEEPICVLTDPVTGLVCPFPNLCFAECAGYSEADVVEEGCDQGWGIDSTLIFFEDCDCEIDPFDELICVEDSLGNVFPFFSACLAECLGFTVLDSTDCGLDWIWDDDWIFGSDSTDWVWNDCDCEINPDEEPVCVLTAAGLICPFPNYCFAECAGYDSTDVVECATLDTLCIGCLDLEIDPVCVTDSSGIVFPVPNACFADCLGLTIVDANCGLDTTWIDPCDCGPDDWNSEGVCIEVTDLTAAGDSLTYIEWVPSTCYADCWGYTNYIVVDCDSIWTWDPCSDCDPEDWNSEGICIELYESTATGDTISYIEWVPSTCYADCWGYTNYIVIDCDSIWTWDPCSDCDPEDWNSEGICIELYSSTATGDTISYIEWVPSTCYADCWGYTNYTVVECDSIWTWTDCGCDPDAWNSEGICIEITEGTATGEVFTFVEWVPSACHADCWGITDYTIVDCDSIWTGGGNDTIFVDWTDCECEFTDIDEMVCVLTDITTGEICPFPNLCFAECAGYTIDDVVPCDVMLPDCFECFDEPMEPVCVTDSSGVVFPVPNACFADCLGLTIIDDEECGGLESAGTPYDRRKDIAYDIPQWSSSNRVRPSQNIIADFSVYPNPVSDLLTIQWDKADNSVTKLNVTDLSGQLIYSENVTMGRGLARIELNVSDWISGIYIVRMEDSANTIVKKIFKE